MSASGGAVVLEGDELEVAAGLRALNAAGIPARALANPPVGLEPRAGWSLRVAAEDLVRARACLGVSEAESDGGDDGSSSDLAADGSGDEVAVDPGVAAVLASAPLVHRLSRLLRRLGWLAAVLLLLLGLVGGVVMIVEALSATPGQDAAPAEATPPIPPPRR